MKNIYFKRFIITICWFALIAYIAPIGTFFGLIGMLMTLPWWVNLIYILGFIPIVVFQKPMMTFMCELKD